MLPVIVRFIPRKNSEGNVLICGNKSETNATSGLLKKNEKTILNLVCLHSVASSFEGYDVNEKISFCIGERSNN